MNDAITPQMAVAQDQLTAEALAAKATEEANKKAQVQTPAETGSEDKPVTLH